MNVFIHDRPWDQGVYVSSLLEEYFRKEGYNIYRLDVNDPSKIDKNIKYDFGFGWGCSSTLAYVRDVLKVPVYVFDLGMIKRTETPMKNEGYFRFGVGDEKWINRGRSNCSDRIKCVGVEFKNNKSYDGKIAFMGQVPGDVSHGMDDVQLYDWSFNVVKNLKDKYRNSEIVYKCHPLTLHNEYQKRICRKMSKLGISVNSSNDRIENVDMSGYRCCITYCSTSAVNFLIHGISVVASKKESIYGDLVSDINGDFDIDFIPNDDVKKQWFNSMTYSQWNKSEISDGVMWNEMKNFLK
jgi:hypothetical protein